MARKKTTTSKKLVKESKGLVLDTTLFKHMVAKAVKGASNNSILPITSMMAIQLQDGKLTLITTDSVNYLYVTQDGIEGDNFNITTMVDTFAALIGKMTSDTIELTLEGNALKVKGNGDYIIELPDEDGQFIEFPDPRNEVELKPLKDIKLADIESIIDLAKPSLAVTLEEPLFVNYFCNNKMVVATDQTKACVLDVKLWKDAKLIPGELMDLVGLMTDETIHVSAANDIIMFSSSDCIVYGRTAEGAKEYPAEDLKSNLLDVAYPSDCKFSKSAMLQLLDRLSLFVSSTDKNIVNLIFTDDGIEVASKRLNGTETVKYLEVNNFVPFTCFIDIVLLREQIRTLPSETVHMYFGDMAVEDEDVCSSLKFETGNATLFLVEANEEFEE